MGLDGQEPAQHHEECIFRCRAHQRVAAGRDGVAFVEKDGAEGLIPAIKVKLVSTHGAGDEFSGALAAELFQGRGIEAALGTANQAAAALVSSER
ncbi:PfkB family carbohydrate kinase [Rhizobium sp.]|uniref:PfkB family carbohydrate kinase n=1 Tax=Rhizobium sp. TaxID=391 RepID=UPI0028978C53